MGSMTKSIHDFQDEHGRIHTWPSDRRRAHQLAILDHLKHLYDLGTSYDHAQAMGILADHTTVEDPGVLLTELVESDYLTTDGEVYWRADGRPGTRG